MNCFIFSFGLLEGTDVVFLQEKYHRLENTSKVFQCFKGTQEKVQWLSIGSSVNILHLHRSISLTLVEILLLE